MVNRLVSVIIMAMLAGAAGAENTTSRVKIHPGMGGVSDIGNADCSLFNEMHYNGPTGMEHHVLTWVQGYVFAKTGANIDALLEPLPDGGGWDFDSLSRVFVDYCKANPDAKVSTAAISLWSVLEAGQSAP